MAKIVSMLAVFVFLSLQSIAQIYDHSFFLNKMPQTPKTVIGISNEEKEAFNTQINSVEIYFDSLARYYQHPMCSLEKSSQQEMFEFNQIWEELYRLQDTYFVEYQTKTVEQMGALSQEEFAKQAELSEKLRKIRNESVKSMKDISGEENRIDKEMYDNHALYCQRNAGLLTKSISHYKSLIENFSHKAKRADTILLPSTMKNVPCAAITNAKNLLLLYREYLSLFAPPYTPKFE